MSFIYSDNQQVKSEFKALVKSKDMTMRSAADNAGIKTPQRLNNIFNKKHLTLDDLKILLDAVGCSLEITFKDN